MQEELTPQRWGSKERMALVAEVLRWKRIALHLSKLLIALTDGEYGEEPDYWLREAEKAVAGKISPKG